MTELSPFDVLEPMLATEGLENRLRGHEFAFTPFLLTPESVSSVRERILDLVFSELCSTNLRRATRAAAALGHALRYPHGYFGNRVDESERELWTPGFVKTLMRLAALAAEESLDPVVSISILDAISWHSSHSPTATKDAARQVGDAITKDFQYELTLCMFNGWGRLSDEDFGRDYEAARNARADRCREIASRLCETGTPNDVVDQVEERLRALDALPSTTSNAGPFIWALVEASPDIGATVAQRVAANPDSMLRGALAVALGAVAEHAPDMFMGVVKPLVAAEAVEVRREVAHSFGWNRGARQLLFDGEGDLLLGLASDPDVIIRLSVVRAAQRIASHRPDVALSLLVAIPFSDASVVADELFAIFGPDGELDWHQLTPDQLEAFLAELEVCPSIEDHWIATFLAELSGDQPDDLVAFLQRRVERAEAEDSDRRYQALPFGWSEGLRVRDTPGYAAALRRITTWIASNSGSWRRVDHGGELFAAVAGTFDVTAMTVIEDAVQTGDDDEIVAASAILRKVPASFALDNVDFVKRVLAAAGQRSREHADRIGGALTAAAVSEVRMGLAGEPFPEDVLLGNRARQIADALPNGSSEQRLYRSLEQTATERMRWQAESDEKFDGRDW